MGRSALLRLEVWIRPEHARDRVSEPYFYVLVHLGMSGAAALTAAWKLPLVLADLLVGAILFDLGRRLHCQRPGLIPTLWLISPVPLWVSAGHGQIESLTVLAIVLPLDLLLRRRPLSGWGCRGVGHRHRVPSSFGRADRHLLALCLFHRASGDVSLCRRLRRCARFLFWATACNRLSAARASIGGLSFTANVASHPHAQVAGPVSSSLWALVHLSPGPLWLAAALVTSVALMIVLARKARFVDTTSDRGRLGILAAGGLLLCVTLFDPGALPQFSVLVVGGLCMVGLCIDLSPAAIILGPTLQLAAGLIWVYGGSFQSYMV